MTRVACAQIDLAALNHNIELAKRHAPSSRCMAVIKANAYGHGATQCASALLSADAFAVSCLEEAISLRQSGVKKPILLLEGVFSSDEVAAVYQYNLWLVVHNTWQLDLLLSCVQIPERIWVKVDTGMHRLGFQPENLYAVIQRLQHIPCQHITIMTHFACADDPADDMTPLQIQRFKQALADLHSSSKNRIHIMPMERHPETYQPYHWSCSLANSAALLAWPESHSNWVRPGIMLYGVSPLIGHTGCEHGLRPVMTLHSRLIATRVVQPGETVGYGATWKAKAATRIGTVSIGYGDGYPRHAPNHTPVKVGDRICSLVGRVSMDMIMVDLSTAPEAVVGDSVVLWGGDLPAETIAEHAGTIAYELLTSLPPRINYEYVNEQEPFHVKT